MKLDLFEQLYEKEQCEDIGSYKINFGKYKGKSYKHIYDNDKSYVVFLIKKLNYETNTIMLDYFKERIETEAEPEQCTEENKLVEKKPRKPRAKKNLEVTEDVKELLINEE